MSIVEPPTGGVGTPPEPEHSAENDERLMTANIDELSGWLDSWLDDLGHPDASSIGELERYANTLPVDRRPTTEPIVPSLWLPRPRAAKAECNWPRCRRSPNPCFAWCKCRCHVHTPPASTPKEGL